MPRSSLIAVGLTGVALAAAGCSSSSTPAPSATPTAVPSQLPTDRPSELPTDRPSELPTDRPTKTASSSGKLPKAPAGAKLLSNHTTAAGEYARYKIDMAPKQVVNKYKNQARNDGYTIKNSGGSGGGWGGWGGSDYGMTATKGSTVQDVQAGGESGSATYYEVCVGSESSSRDHCENRSQHDHQQHQDSHSHGS